MSRVDRPAGVNVGVFNPGDTVYVKGNESTDGSIRFQIILIDDEDVTEIQERIAGVWQIASLITQDPPTLHDRQAAFSVSDQTTSSATFVDITGASLTACGLDVPGTYNGWFTFIVAASAANTIASFRITINGTPFEPIGRQLIIKTSNQDMAVTFLLLITDIVCDDVIQMQWATDKGILTMEEFDMLFDGIRNDRVVE